MVLACKILNGNKDFPKVIEFVSCAIIRDIDIIKYRGVLCTMYSQVSKRAHLEDIKFTSMNLLCFAFCHVVLEILTRGILTPLDLVVYHLLT